MAFAYAEAETAGQAAVPQADQAYPQVKALAGEFAGPENGVVGVADGAEKQSFGFAYAEPNSESSRKALAGGPRVAEPVHATVPVGLSESTVEPVAPAAAVDQPATADPEDAEAGKIAIPEVWVSAFRSWTEQHERYPSEEELALHLYNLPEKERVRARGADRPVSKRSVERYYGELKKMFPIADQPQLELEGAGR
ncbi:hypothetical protein ACFRKE_03325 [Kitasatospora indigofera]|uniref:hypothetical protein n=1 Tax=Kitasatospora indigofera TaxID=67307 RepID=UPI0036B6360A